MALLTRHAVVIVAAFTAAVGVRPGAARGQETAEQEIKAAFLYNFTKFVEWPALPANTPFRVCVAAGPTFTRAFDQIIDGESVQGRQLVRIDATAIDAPKDCQVLYVGRSNEEQIAGMLASVGQAPVLTVGEAPRFVKEGGAIQFVLENNRVRFDVNLPVIERSGLKVSSKLLRVARNVEPGVIR